MLRRFGCLFITLMILQSYGGSSFAVSEDEIASLLGARYRITKPSFLGGFKEIGTVFVLRRDGLRANRPSKIFSPNVVNGRRIEKAGGGDIPPGGDIDPDLKTGDRLHLYGISTGENYVQLDLFSVKTFVVTGGATRGPTPLQASTRFIYDEGLEAVSAERIFDDVHEWFAAEGEPISPEESRRLGDSGSAKTVQQGQSREDVVAVLGPPAKIFLLGAKTVFVYPDIKVIFIDGKVTDAE